MIVFIDNLGELEYDRGYVWRIIIYYPVVY
jgi:hypothetical protein